MYHTTGLDKAEILDLCEMIHREAVADERTWPPILGLYKSVVVTLTYLRRNRVQAEIAEAFEVSQPTISRAVSAMTGLVERALRRYVPTADELDDCTQYVVDGTLLPCWSWAGHPGLYSGKHKTTGLNVQVVCTLDGGLAWISDPVDGSRHDTYCLRESGALTSAVAANWTGDKGYVGTGTLTPFKKPTHRDLLDWEKTFNTEINKIRYVIEQIIANFKTWRILHTDYRRPLATFVTTIAAVVGLHFYRAA
jgi:DDE superfamily endonuclease/Helix-turn-helix of DDE superfamily endonuclease